MKIRYGKFMVAVSLFTPLLFSVAAAQNPDSSDWAGSTTQQTTQAEGGVLYVVNWICNVMTGPKYSTKKSAPLSSTPVQLLLQHERAA
jgi:hypothetical protein